MAWLALVLFEESERSVRQLIDARAVLQIFLLRVEDAPALEEVLDGRVGLGGGEPAERLPWTFLRPMCFFGRLSLNGLSTKAPRARERLRHREANIVSRLLPPLVRRLLELPEAGTAASTAARI